MLPLACFGETSWEPCLISWQDVRRAVILKYNDMHTLPPHIETPKQRPLILLCSINSCTYVCYLDVFETSVTHCCWLAAELTNSSSPFPASSFSLTLISPRSCYARLSDEVTSTAFSTVDVVVPTTAPTDYVTTTSTMLVSTGKGW